MNETFKVSLNLMLNSKTTRIWHATVSTTHYKCNWNMNCGTTVFGVSFELFIIPVTLSHKKLENVLFSTIEIFMNNSIVVSNDIP